MGIEWSKSDELEKPVSPLPTHIHSELDNTMKNLRANPLTESLIDNHDSTSNEKNTQRRKESSQYYYYNDDYYTATGRPIIEKDTIRLLDTHKLGPIIDLNTADDKSFLNTHGIVDMRKFQ